LKGSSPDPEGRITRRLHVYRVSPDEVRCAAAERANAVRISDHWVKESRDPASPALRDERVALVRSYAALLAAVHR
jgi:hypothetical protein